MKHVPGPWYMEGNLIRGDYGHVCETVPGSLGKADARLICAAPDLLAACKWVLVNIDHDVNDFIPLKDAVAKAEGTQ